MAVTSNNGIYTTSGDGNLTVTSVFLTGEGTPSNPPTDVDELWFYQDTLTGAVYYWSVSGVNWLKFLSSVHAGFNSLSVQSVAPLAEWQPVKWQNSGVSFFGDTSLFNDSVMWPEYLQIRNSGVYLITATLGLNTVSTVSADNNIYLRLNRTSQDDYAFVASTVSLNPFNVNNTNAIYLTLSGQTIFTENDLVSLEIYHTASGVNLNVIPDSLITISSLL